MDLNDKPIGFYTYNSASGNAPLNTPFDTPKPFIFLGFGPGTSSGWGMQFVASISEPIVLYYRTHVSSSFNDWKKVTDS